ncbi:MAG TPA: lactate utilization protein [Thermodesulfobacteriota bacterium]|nr:lactate utilization protein [Thermodesulfobacteriota bacterium]
MESISLDIISKLVDKLKKQEMSAAFFPTAEEAKKIVVEKIPRGAKVGLGGSVTLRELGIPDLLRSKGCTVFDHWNTTSKEEREAAARKHPTADIFLTSTNALTLDGKFINVDASGNRIVSMIFGPQKVIVVAGVNKIVKNVNEGLARIKKVVAPQNCRRRSDPTPCAEDLVCHNCDTPARLCRVTTIIERKPWGVKEFEVILVGENLGY